jgi:PleD family two-component response regulator
VKYKSESAQALINRADNLLYQAKNNGRNRIEILLEN